MIRDAVFISYRRNDNRSGVERIRDRLVLAFGADAIFKDVDSIPPGEDFRAYISTVLSKCKVQLVVIGAGWFEARDASGARRIDDPTDMVRLEVEMALGAGLRVVPVLLNTATLNASALPPSLQKLTALQSAVIRDDPDFHGDADRLIATLRTHALPDFSSGPGAIWAEIRETDDIDTLDRFIDNFPGTVEAYRARERKAQAMAFHEVNDGSIAYLDEQLDCMGLESVADIIRGGDGNVNPDESDGPGDEFDVANRVLAVMERIDTFLDKWHPSDLATRLLELRASASTLLGSVPAGAELVLPHYEDERSDAGKRDWSVAKSDH